MKKKYEEGFKAKVAIEGLKGDLTIAEISEKYEVHENLVIKWKKELIEKAGIVFEKRKKRSKEEEEKESRIEALEKQLGKAYIERDFLKKKYVQLYGKEPDLLRLK